MKTSDELAEEGRRLSALGNLVVFLYPSQEWMAVKTQTPFLRYERIRRNPTPALNCRDANNPLHPRPPDPRHFIMNSISVAINLPSDANASPWDFSSALQQASADAMMRGDAIGAAAIMRLQILVRLPHTAPIEYYLGQGTTGS